MLAASRICSQGTYMASHLTPPLKSVAGSLVFTAILGPVGLLYASFWAALVMIPLGIIVISIKLIFPIILVWIICCVLGVAAAERYNRRVLSRTV
jgi:hypothetical protein